MKKEIKISMIVTIPDNTTLEQFNEEFVDWIEGKDCECCGSMKPYMRLWSMEDAKDLILGEVGTERRDTYEAELKKRD